MGENLSGLRGVSDGGCGEPLQDVTLRASLSLDGLACDASRDLATEVTNLSLLGVGERGHDVSLSGLANFSQ